MKKDDGAPGVPARPHILITGNEATLSFPVEPLGFAAVLATGQPLSAHLKDLLAFMARRSERPLSNYSKDWKPIPQTMVEIAATKPATSPPQGMLRIPEADYDFHVRGIEIEGGNDPGVDIHRS